MADEPHIADAEAAFYVLAVTPDFCEVHGSICPFDPVRILPPERQSYSASVHARDERVLLVDSIIQGTEGNDGEGAWSGVSLEDGDVLILEGSETVFIEDRQVARDGDLCLMNVKTLG